MMNKILQFTFPLTLLAFLLTWWFSPQYLALELALIVPIAPVIYTPGSENLAGLYGKMMIIAHKDIETWPLLAENGVSYTGNFELQPGTKFEEIYFTSETGLLNFTRLGSIDNGAFENKAAIKIPGANVDNYQFARATVNGGYAIIVQHSDGTKFVVGSELIVASLSALEGSSGGAPGDDRGVMYEFRQASPSPPVRYLGEVSSLLIASPLASAATSLTADSFEANWGEVTDAEGYALDVSEEEDFSTFVVGFENKAIPSGTLTDAVSGLSASTTYYFRVRTKKGTNVSGSSNIISVTTPAV